MKFYRLDDGSDRFVGLDDDLPDHLYDQIPELIENGLIDTSYEKTYSQEEFNLAMNPPTPTWVNTLTSHQERSSSNELLQTAFTLGYTYFAWNGHLHKVTNYHQNLSYELVEDIYEIDIK